MEMRKEQRMIIKASDSAQIKERGILFFGTAFFLHISIHEAQFDGRVHYFFIFIGCNPAVDFRIHAALMKGRVLAHET